MHKDTINILCVDDEHEVTSLVKDVLSGYSVYTAESATSAIKMIGSRDFDLVITDMDMLPDGSGLAVLKSVRKSNKKETPVILMTGRGENEKYVSEGFDDFIMKPFSIDLLRRRVMKILTKKHHPAR